MSRRIYRSLTRRGRWMACMALFAFTAGNIGWPVTTGSVAGGTCCQVSGLATCCCGDRPGARNCGCNKGSAIAKTEPVKKLPSCCQKRLAAAERATGVVSCACGESSTPGFVVSTQPKITVVVVSVAELTITGDLVPPHAVLLAGATLSPETPPPRPSVS